MRDLVQEYNDLITRNELCEMLKISKSVAYHLLSSNQIPAFKIGRIWKIPRAAVEEYIRRSSGMIKK